MRVPSVVQFLSVSIHPVDEHETASGVVEMRKSRLQVKVGATPEGIEMSLQGPVEPAEDDALFPIVGAVLLGAEGQHAGYAVKKLRLQ